MGSGVVNTSRLQQIEVRFALKTKFYEQYLDYTQEELFAIVLHSHDFNAESVTTARCIIRERGWGGNLNKLLQENKLKNAVEQERYVEEIKLKAEHYRNVLAFKEGNHFFQVRIADASKFEAALYINRIGYYKEDKHIGMQLDNYPAQTYYFKKKDVLTVDKIIKSLEMNVSVSSDKKTFLNFEVKATLIVLAFIILLFYWLG